MGACTDVENESKSKDGGGGEGVGRDSNTSSPTEKSPLAEGAVARPCSSKVGAVGPPDSPMTGGGIGGMGGMEAVDESLPIRVIDDFEVSESPFTLPKKDGRKGYWVESSWLTPQDAKLQGGDLDITMGEENDNSYLRLVCDEDDPCNTKWSKEKPYQWAGATAFFNQGDGVACYDAKVYLGIKFRARAASEGQKLRVQLNTPSDHREKRDTFTSKEIVLGKQWLTRTIWFREALLQSGEEVDPSELESITFAVQNVKNFPNGQRLLPYDIHIDDIVFVKK